MRSMLLVFTGMVLLSAGSLLAQSCADVNGDGHVNISDMVYMLNEHIGGPALAPGTGDCDFRQGYNTGDARCVIDYIFSGGVAPGCPPFSPYTLTVSDDSLFLPSYSVPAGSGQFVLPIYLLNHMEVADMVLPFTVSGMGTTIFLDSLRLSSTITSHGIGTKWVNGSTGVIAFSLVYSWQQVFTPGVNLLAEAYFHHNSSPGGVIIMDTTTLRPHTFLNYIYGHYASGPSSDLTIGIPTVVVTSNPGFPTMMVAPDSLTFETLAGLPDPVGKWFTVSSDGSAFSWTLTTPAWVSVSASSGTSGLVVMATPNISGIPVGTYYGDIMVFSTLAIGSPKKVTVKLTLKPQFPSLDANCDGVYNITDVVAQINYIFGGEQTLCDPCTGLPVKK